MNRKSTYFVTGIFTIIGLVIAVMAILLFGAGRVLEDRIVMETYINESVQGLDIGSPVKFRGVQVGNVQDINFTRNLYELEKPYEDRKEYVLVEFELQPKAIGVDGTPELQLAIKKLTQNGLRVRLASANLTGVAYLELDFTENPLENTFDVEWTPHNPYIPSKESSISRLLTSVEDVFEKLEAIDVTQIITKVESTLDVMQEKIEQIDTKALSDETVMLVKELRQTNQDIRNIVTNLELEGISDQASETLLALQEKINALDLTGVLDSLESSIQELDQLVAGNKKSLGATLNNFQILSSGLRALSDQARKSPSSVIFSNPPGRVLPTQ